MGCRLFLVALLVHLSIAQTPKLQYMVLVPSVLQSNTSNQACIQLMNLNEKVSFRLVLEYSQDSHGLWEGTIEEKEFSQCISFKVPVATSDPLAFIDFSAKGATVDLQERRSMAIRNPEGTVFVQTDKPIYKPGQKVMFRVVSLDNNFATVNEVYPAIYLLDPQRNQIAQWLDQSSGSGILQLSHELANEPLLGSYVITVKTASKKEASHYFSVDEYVLPKFAVEIEAPQNISPFDDEFQVRVCANYTYGQPVQGTVALKVCRRQYFLPECNRDSDGICQDIAAELGQDGCTTKMIPTKMYRLYMNVNMNMNSRHFFFASLTATAVVTETGTGIQKSGSKYISVYQARKNIGFQDIDQYYKRGMPYTGKMNLRDENNEPIAKGLIILELNGNILANYTTDEKGMAQFSIQTSDLFEPRYKLRAFYQPDPCSDDAWLQTYVTEATVYMQRFFSRINSFVKIEPVQEELKCDQQSSITVHYILNEESYTADTTVYFHYILMSHGQIVDGGNKQISIKAGQYSNFPILLDINQQLAPRTRMLVYTLHNSGEMVADSVSFEIEKCFRNKVSLQFSEPQALPASQVTLNVKAAANSLCALSAVDQSVFLLRPGAELSPYTVYGQRSFLDLYGYYYGGLNLEDYPELPCIEFRNTYFGGMYYVPVNVTDDGNVYDIVKAMGLKFFSSFTLQKPVVCQSGFECKRISSPYDYDYPPSADGTMEAASGKAGGFAGGMTETVRTFFPETWIWDLATVDSSGNADVKYTVPDTITEWKAQAFCLDNTAGFGIAKQATLKAFQPFFVEVTLPYSIVRGEDFLLKANVFSYQNQCMEVSFSYNLVQSIAAIKNQDPRCYELDPTTETLPHQHTKVKTTLEESQHFKAENLSPDNSFTRLCANEKKTSTWRISPLKLGTQNFTVTAEARSGEGDTSVGRKDTVVKPLLVEPEGIKKEVTQSSLICAKGTTISESVVLNLPSNMVEGSARAIFSVIGDVLGTAMKNSEDLLQLPSGCGEQNIAKFLSTLIILDYLNDTKQLTDDKRSRLVGHLMTGYQRQLAFRLSDGSFTTFSSRGEEGNLWLTSLSYKALARSKKYIYVDDNVLSQALIWITSKQEQDGSFIPVGKMFNNGLKSEADAKLQLTMYITTCLLESQLAKSLPVVKKSLDYLNAVSDQSVKSTYDKIVLAYIFGLVDNVDKQRQLLEDLKGNAITADGTMHWEREKKPAAEKVASFYPRASSAEIEMNAYALLAWLHQPNLSKTNLTDATKTTMWLVRQQNFYGGFSSTQDTIVALQALAKYGNLTFTKEAQNTVKISTGDSVKKEFQVDGRNRVLLQQTTLATVPGTYSVEVAGSGCIYTQTALRYNVQLPEQSSGFSLAAETKNAACTGNVLPRFDLALSASYTGMRNTSNMVILDVKILSGFVAVDSSLQKLQDKVMRIETRNDHVMLYLDSVSLCGELSGSHSKVSPSSKHTFEFTVEQSHPVGNSKPAEAVIYDYYETDEFGRTEYNTPCQQASA